MSMIIKAGDAAKIKPLLSRVDLADHLAEAQAVVDAARSQALNLMEEASEHSVVIKKEAHESGYEEGYKEGYESGRIKGHEDAFKESVERFRDEQKELLDVVAHVLQEVDLKKDAMLVAARQDVLELAVTIATRLTYAVGGLNNESAKANLDRILTMVGRPTDLQLRINPADADAIRSYCDELLGHLDDAAHTTFVEDAAVAPGGCVVQFAGGEVDASLETQVERMVGSLLGVAHDGAGAEIPEAESPGTESPGTDSSSAKADRADEDNAAMNEAAPDGSAPDGAATKGAASKGAGAGGSGVDESAQDGSAGGDEDGNDQA